MARISALVDVLNDVIVDSEIVSYTKESDGYKQNELKVGNRNIGIDERSLAIKHIENIDNSIKKNLLLFDRGYPSRELIAYLQEKGHKFVMRCSKSFLKEVTAAKRGITIITFKFEDKI